MMPVIDGYEVCKHLKQNQEKRLIPIIMVTALNDMESRIKGIETGADDFLSKPINKIEIQARTKALISTKKLNDKLTSIENMIVLLANAVEAKDKCTEGHVQRVSEMAVLLGKKLSLASHEITALRYGGILHDIGKIRVSDTILNKPEPLSGEERQIINQHPLVGYKICLPLKKTLGIAIDMILHHHEKLDGSGYPEGLKGNDISVAARIMAIADIYDALISDRPYKKGMSHQQAMSILSREADAGQLDKTIIDMI
jgi:putative two-component system response regulator